jgi:uncharacterized membrane protein YheB (UPF0754 family)
MPAMVHTELGRDNSPRLGTASKQNLLGAFEEEKGWGRYINKGDISNLATLIVMLLGLAWYSKDPDNEPAKYIFSFGLFGFSGGVTNWLAIKMLFYDVGLVGSGVIPKQFIPIRNSIKDMMMQMFFDIDFLRDYISKRAKQFVKEADFGDKVGNILTSPEFEVVLTKTLTDLSMQPEGMILQTMAPMFGGIEGMIPMLKPMLVSAGKEIVDSTADNFDPLSIWSVEQIRDQLENMIETKLLELTPEMITEMMDSILHAHLGWLIIWGNVFGGLIGLISQWAGYGAN